MRASRPRRRAIAALAALGISRSLAVEPALASAARRALALRDEAIRRGDQAYGAVVVKDGRIVGEGVSAVLARGDPDAHAERIALGDARARHGDALVRGAVLVGSSPACARCAEAARQAGIARLYFGPGPADGGAP
jgi:tRNA(Arg) A34 adenosine deaminase TadA